MEINDECVLVPDRHMSVQMAMRFGSYPAFVLMLMMLVMNMKVLVRGRLMPVLKLDRIVGRPKFRRQQAWERANCAAKTAGQIVCQERKRHRRQARAREGRDLRREQPAVCSVRK
tara:strand:- start:329 stop:673 length:345 start_codon:yes stop_codon:yes gene_type:complete